MDIFKKGDRVRVNYRYPSHLIHGIEGVVVGGGYDYYSVDLDNGLHGWLLEPLEMDLLEAAQ